MIFSRVLLLGTLSVVLLAFAVVMRPLRSPEVFAVLEANSSETNSSRFEDRFSSDETVGASADSSGGARPALDGRAKQVASAPLSVNQEPATDGVGLYVSAMPLEEFMARTESGMQRWSGVAIQAADASGVPREFFLRLLSQESGFKPTSISRAGALGIAQFMPATAIAVGLKDPFEPVSAISASATHLATLIKRFGNVGLAAAAYNAGPERVSAWLSGKRGLPEETRSYVRQVTGFNAEKWIGTDVGIMMSTSSSSASIKLRNLTVVHKAKGHTVSTTNLCQAINSTGGVCRVQSSY